VAGIRSTELPSQLPSCSWCGGTTDRPGAVALVFAGFPDQEAGCTSTHADLLVARRADALLEREALPATPHPEGVAA
jgi:hypothetical protein